MILALSFLQAVHMIFTGRFDEEWNGDEERASKLVFIGKNLDHAELWKGFESCLYSEDRAKRKLESLRFKVGDQVEVQFRGTWRKGEIQAVMFRARMPGSLGKVAPYCVRLENGPRMLAPADTDDVIRKVS